MEYSKYVAFTIQCNNCSRGWSLSDKELLEQKAVCLECSSEFSVYEGIKNGLKNYKDHIFTNMFLANDMYNLMINVKIGYTTHIELPENITKIYKILLFPVGPFLTGATDITPNGFNVFTSLAEDSDRSVIGEDANVMAMIHFKGEDYVTPWLHLLQYALDQLVSGEYLTCILLSEIAFESYVDSTLTMGYTDTGLDNDSISRFLTATEMQVKVNPLMNNLFGMKLSSSPSWNNWEKKVLKWRNEIAHGTKVTATREEAILAYETVVDSLFHLIEGVDNHLKQKGIQNGMFYRNK